MAIETVRNQDGRWGVGRKCSCGADKHTVSCRGITTVWSDCESAADVIEVLHDRVHKLSREVERLREEVASLSVPHFYWNGEPEGSVYDPSELGENCEPGDVVRVIPIHELPEEWVVITDGGYSRFGTQGEAEKAAEAMRAGDS